MATRKGKLRREKTAYRALLATAFTGDSRGAYRLNGGLGGNPLLGAYLRAGLGADKAGRQIIGLVQCSLSTLDHFNPLASGLFLPHVQGSPPVWWIEATKHAGRR